MHLFTFIAYKKPFRLVLLFWILFFTVDTPLFSQDLKEYNRIVEKYFASYTPSIDYERAYKELSILAPEMLSHAEFQYFLGLTAGKSNLANMHYLPQMNRDVAYLALSSLQKALTLGYQHTIPHLSDAYYRYTTEWGQLLLLSLLEYEKESPAITAFIDLVSKAEIAPFTPFMLSAARTMMSECSPDAFLICNDDNLYYAVLYLILKENLRNDIIPIRKDLLHTAWYPLFLEKQYGISFGIAPDKLRVAFEMPVEQTLKEIEKSPRFSLGTSLIPKVLSKNLLGKNIMRDDFLLLKLLSLDTKERGFFYGLGFTERDMWGLYHYQINGFTKELLLFPHSGLNGGRLTVFSSIESALKEVNIKSRQELNWIDELRKVMIKMTGELYDTGSKGEASLCFLFILDQLGFEKYPTLDPANYELFIKMASFFMEDKE